MASAAPPSSPEAAVASGMARGLAVATAASTHTTGASAGAATATTALATTATISPTTQVLGYIVSLGSSLVKIPQLYSIIRARSVSGVSLSMFILETLTTSVSALYSYRRGVSFSSYGENVAIGMMDLGILALFKKYSTEYVMS